MLFVKEDGIMLNEAERSTMMFCSEGGQSLCDAGKEW